MQPLIGLAKTPHATAAGAGVRDTTTESFMADVIDASHELPIIVDFWAPWCGPCKALGPILERAVAETKGAVRMFKLDIDQNQELAAQMRIQSIPAVYAFFQGRPIDGFVGAQPESQIKAFVGRLVAQAGSAAPAASPVAEALAQAKLALAEGDTAAARTLYGQILQHEPANLEAAIGLGRCHVAAGDLKKAREALARLPKAEAAQPEARALETAIDLAEQAKAAGSPRELERRLARDPDDHQARFDLAMARYHAHDRAGAVEGLLELVRRDRAWNDEAARKQLVRLFEAFGPADPLTGSSRRRLSTILFA